MNLRLFALTLILTSPALGQNQAVDVTLTLETNRLVVGTSTLLRAYAQITPTLAPASDQIFSYYLDCQNSAPAVLRGDFPLLAKPASDNDPRTSSPGFASGPHWIGIFDTFLEQPGAGKSSPVLLFTVPLTGLTPGTATLRLAPGSGVPNLSRDFIVAPLVGDTPLVGGNYHAATVTVEVVVPALPVAQPVSVTMLEDTQHSGTLQGTDPIGTPLTFRLLTPATHGTVSVQSSGAFTYTPAPDFFGSDSFRYEASNGNLTSAPATVTLDVQPVNDPPNFAPGPNVLAPKNSGPQSILGWATAIRAGPTNEANQSLSLQVASTPSDLFSTPPTLDPSGTLRFTPAAGVSGTASVTVTLRDNGGTAHGGQDSSTHSFTILLLNDPPVSAPAEYSTHEDRTLQGQLTSSDPNGDPLTFRLLTPATHGTVSVQSSGAFTYTPAPDFFGSDSFRYEASDGTLASAPATVTLGVQPVNDPPSFTPGPHVLLTSDAGPQILPGWATEIRAGPPSEDQQRLTFHLENDRPTLFAKLPALAPDGTLAFSPAPNAEGIATLTVRLQDDGGTARGGIDSSPPQTFTITLQRPTPTTLVLHAPTIQNGRFRFTWTSVTGQTYRLQSTTNLAETPWQTLSPDLVATGPLTAFEEPAPSGPRRFFRVQQMP